LTGEWFGAVAYTQHASKTYHVRFHIAGDGAVALTYHALGGVQGKVDGTADSDVVLPWSKQWTIRAFVLALGIDVSSRDRRDISCSITVNGRVLDHIVRRASVHCGGVIY
jgi:hypothetical protein